jgi:hypothetical protein
MSGFTDLDLGGAAGLLQLGLGALLFLAPGLAAVDRLLGLRERGWMFAPVFSFTLLPLGAIVLDLFFHVRITPLSTVGLAVGWTLIFGRRRLLGLASDLRGALARARPLRPTGRQALATVLLLAAIATGVAIHLTPHLPGERADAWSAYPDLGARVVGLLEGKDSPFPIHVDEHHHLAEQAAIKRQGHIEIDDPYTGLPSSQPLFSVSGFRQERGFNLAMVQLQDLTGVSLAAQARVVPALQSGLTAGLMYAVLAPGPGALAAAGLVGIIPTTVRFLGPGFLVPHTFALPWILTGLYVSLRAQGGRRLGGLALIETGAFLMHLVPGVLTLAVATIAAAVRPGRISDRVALVGASLLPLVWLAPLAFTDAKAAVLGETELPFQPGILATAGLPALVAAALGSGLAFAWPRALPAHRALGLLAMGLLVSILVSVRLDHHSDATYSRLVPPLFLCLAALAGLGLAGVADLVGRLVPSRPLGRWRPAAGTAVTGVLVLLVLAPAVADHLSTPYYRVLDDRSWRDARILETSGAGGEDRFLSDPWQAPIFNMASGARPHAVLLPGSGSAGGADWLFYLSSNGASQEWFDERHIDYVVGPGPPNAEHERIGGRVYRIVHLEA